MLNKMTVIGRLGRDPEMRYTANGNAVTSFSVATGSTYTTRGGEERNDTEWFTVVTWDRTAENCNQYLVKGRMVYVEGRLKSSSWTGQDGQTRFRNEINAQRVVFLNSGSNPSQGPNDSTSQIGGYEEPSDPMGDIGDAEDLPW